MPAIPKHTTATVDEAWDGPAAVAAMPAAYATLHYCHAWWSDEAANDSGSHDGSADGDDDADDKKANYKFPHSKTKGGPANIPACRNGLSRLEGSTIPEADKSGVKAHLQAHIDDFDKDHGDADDKLERTMTNTIMGRALHIANLSTEERARKHVARSQMVSNKQEWYRIRNETGAGGVPAVLELFDEIGFWGVTASDFSQALNGITADAITVHINSGGGDVFDGLAILNLLRAHKATVNTVVDGLAASAASFIAMAGETVTMMPQSTMMIHDASGICFGNAQDMTETAQLLDKMSDNIAAIYQSKAGGTVEDWRGSMRNETWYSDQEALTAGLADRVGDTDEPVETGPTDHWNMSFYQFSNRAAAPAPTAPVTVQAPKPVVLDIEDLAWDPSAFHSALGSAQDTSTTDGWNADQFRNAMKEARA